MMNASPGTFLRKQCKFLISIKEANEKDLIVADRLATFLDDEERPDDFPGVKFEELSSFGKQIHEKLLAKMLNELKELGIETPDNIEYAKFVALDILGMECSHNEPLVKKGANSVCPICGKKFPLIQRIK
jgi:rubrerythrin